MNLIGLSMKEQARKIIDTEITEIKKPDNLNDLYPDKMERLELADKVLKQWKDKQVDK